MEHCIAQPGQWPDASAEVSDEEMEDFLAHAEECPYHAELLREEFEHELRTAFLLAGGLDAHGRLLRGDELRGALAEQEQRAGMWHEAGRTESPFGHICLYHDDRLIASCGKFRNRVYQQALHDLDPGPGLQIRARCGADVEEEVLLGFYALRGVRHDDEEMLLRLDNDYKVGLRVRQIGDRSFMVRFRCFQSGLAGGEEEDDAAALGWDGAAPPSPGHDLFVPQMPPLTGWQVHAGAGALMILALFSLFLFATLGVKGTGGGASANANTLSARDDRQHADAAPPPQTPQAPVPTAFETPSAPAPVTQKRRRRHEGGAPRMPPGASELAMLFAGGRHDGNPQVPVHAEWAILSSCREEGGFVEVKHSGSDPEVKEKLLQALTAPDSRCEVVAGPDDAPAQTAYLALWRLVQPQPGDSPVCKIEVEVHTANADSGECAFDQEVCARLMLRSRVTPSDDGPDYEVAVRKTVKAIYKRLFMSDSAQDSPRGTAQEQNAPPAPRDGERFRGPQLDGYDSAN